MTRFYELLERRDLPEFCHERLGELYVLLSEAWRSTDDAEVRARLTDLAAYLHYTDLALQAAFELKNRTPQEEVDLAFEITRHSERLRDSPMLSLGSVWRMFFSRAVQDHRALVPRNTEFDVDWPENPLRERRPFTAAEVEKILADGQKSNPVPSFKPVQFSRKLVPATALNLPSQPRLPIDSLSVEWRTLRAYVPEGHKSVVLRLKAGGDPKDPSIGTRLEFRRVAEEGSDTSSSQNVYRTRAVADGKWHTIELPAPTPGLYVLDISSNRVGNEIDWDRDQLLTDWCEAETFPKPTLAYSRYFYVPKGTREVAGFAGRSSGGEVVDATGRVVHRFDGGRARMFTIPVPEGQDGKVWLLRNSVFAKLFMTVPPSLARSAEELLLPEEVVARDRAQ